MSHTTTNRGRVVSKNLFNFTPRGKMDEEIVKGDAEAAEKAKASPVTSERNARMKELETLTDEASNAEYAKLWREMMESLMLDLVDPKRGEEEQKIGRKQTDTKMMMVPTTHHGDHNVLMEVYTPKALANETKRTAYLFAHGGGMIALSASQSGPILRYDAVTMNVVIFNVEYRLAPETKCPNNIKDFYECIKYVSKNAESLGIDPDKIVIGGKSSGGYICLGAMVLLAEAGEGHLVKLALPTASFVDDYCFSDPLAMTIEERGGHGCMRKIFRDMVADDFEVQKTSPYLFPGKVSDELLAEIPPTIFLESEFDIFITETSRLARRMQRAGRLLEFVSIPGATHVSPYYHLYPGSNGHVLYREVMLKIAAEYIHSEIKYT